MATTEEHFNQATISKLNHTGPKYKANIFIPRQSTEMRV